MERLIIVCEGETEREFCESLLYDYFLRKGIVLSCPIIKRTAGGVASWHTLRSQIMSHLSEGAYVTMLIDYYGIKDNLCFPGWEEAKCIVDKMQRLSFIESKMGEDVNHYKFIPYLQLHEFEALLFNNINSFEAIIPEDEFTDKDALVALLRQYPNPELINNHPSTSPSHRLLRLIQGYDKVVYGNLVALEIGLERIRARCVRFNEWICKLENIRQ